MFNRRDRHADRTDDVDHAADADRGRHTDERVDRRTVDDVQRERYGGTSLAGAFFGWLVAVGVVILLSGIIGAVAAAVGTSQDITPSDADGSEGTIGIVAAAVLLLVLAIGYYCGGYVAGRMARFHGTKQGRAVWLLGLLVTILAAVLGAVFGSQYNVLDRVSVPEVPIPTDDLSIGGIIALVAALLVTFLAAVLGGKAGTHFHRKVDRVV